MTSWTAETAEWYADRYGEHPTNRLAVDALDIAADALVVDVGCGTGAALRHAAPRVPSGRLVGVDPVPRMLEIARERSAGHPAAARIAFRQGAAESLPLETGTVDLVLAFDSLDHWEDVPRGLGEVARVLRPRGRLALVKDGSVPGAGQAGRTLETALAEAGFRVLERGELSGEGVRCGLWVCARERTGGEAKRTV